ncbi:myeloid-associated differentiation marker isoform X1 [Carettochelys insculpta]|uniref:myeloid-associated differentiation marker isoform X1 n=2 Tax=Carettochelys insculpta TaxID=44489 RepID=UPI003EB79CA6
MQHGSPAAAAAARSPGLRAAAHGDHRAPQGLERERLSTPQLMAAMEDPAISTLRDADRLHGPYFDVERRSRSLFRSPHELVLSGWTSAPDPLRPPSACPPPAALRPQRDRYRHLHSPSALGTEGSDTALRGVRNLPRQNHQLLRNRTGSPQPLLLRGDSTMPVQHSKSIGNTQVLTSQLGIVRLLEVLFSCITFSLVVHRGGWYGHNGDWCMFCWCFCFAMTLLVLVVEFAGLQHRMPVSWKNFPITFAMYAVLMCLSASVIYPVTHIQENRLDSKTKDYRIAATVFSCLTCLAYMAEVTMTRAKPGEVTGYMATVPGLLKVVETFVACIIFVFISDPVSYNSPEALKWCMAVYCICFILSLVVIVLCIGECTGWLPCAFNKFLSGYTLLAVLMYATATIIWPIYKFDRQQGGQPSRPCYGRSFCYWDKLVAIAVLTAINLLVYLADLVYSARLIFIQA